MRAFAGNYQKRLQARIILDIPDAQTPERQSNSRADAEVPGVERAKRITQLQGNDQSLSFHYRRSQPEKQPFVVRIPGYAFDVHRILFVLRQRLEFVDLCQQQLAQIADNVRLAPHSQDCWVERESNQGVSVSTLRVG